MEYPAREAKLTDKFKKFRVKLEEEQARLKGEYAQLEADSGGQERRDGSPFGKREEEATETAELEKRLALETRINQQQAQVARALDKIEEGNYGTCDRCGQPIGEGRLEALPWASLCLKCKAESANNPRGKLAGL
jgi:DnaK suppressor protein